MKIGGRLVVREDQRAFWSLMHSAAGFSKAYPADAVYLVVKVDRGFWTTLVRVEVVSTRAWVPGWFSEKWFRKEESK